MQDGGEADVGAQMLLIRCDGRERLGCGLKQEAIDLGLVLVGDRTDDSRQSEHDVKIGDRQQLCLARFEPGLRRQAPV